MCKAAVKVVPRACPIRNTHKTRVHFGELMHSFTKSDRQQLNFNVVNICATFMYTALKLWT